jgi:hypothetical protein
MSLAERGALNVPLVELIRTASGKEPSQRPWETVSPLAACLEGDRFDVVLRFDRAGPGAAWSFRQLFPRLLSGDSDVALG